MNSNTRFIVLKAELWSVASTPRLSCRAKRPTAVMVFDLIALGDKAMPPIFLDAGPRITEMIYQRQILMPVLEWLKEVYEPHDIL